VNRLEGRVIRLERDGGRNGWRAHAGVPMEHWPDDALLGFLAESEGWPDDYVPTDEELRAIASAAPESGEDGGAA
jgi:hypothetical protein